jgi:hypothetical protein
MNMAAIMKKMRGDAHAAFDTTIGGWAATDNRVRQLSDILMTTRWETSWLG